MAQEMAVGLLTIKLGRRRFRLICTSTLSLPQLCNIAINDSNALPNEDLGALENKTRG